MMIKQQLVSKCIHEQDTRETLAQLRRSLHNFNTFAPITSTEKAMVVLLDLKYHASWYFFTLKYTDITVSSHCYQQIQL